MNLLSGEEFYDSAPDFDESLVVDISAPSTGKVGESISFTGTIEDSGASLYSWEWSFGDGESLSQENQTDITFTASHIYTAAGTYNVYLDAMDDDYNYGSASHTITITTNQNNNGNNNNGNNNNDNNADNSGSSDSNISLWLFIGLIFIIVIVGTVVLVVILRR
jgi:PKD repeat protein